MKTAYYLSILLLFSIHSILVGQSKRYAGVGASLDFNQSIGTPNGNTGLQPADRDYNTFSLHSFLNLNSHKLFQLRINTRLSAKQISLASDELVTFGETMINSLGYTFIGVDLGLSAMYAIPIKQHKLLPTFGVYSAFNFSTPGFSFGPFDRTLHPRKGIPVRTNRPTVINLGFNAGLLFQTTIKGYPIEFFSMAYFSGTDTFEATFNYKSIPAIEYKGRIRSMALGFNIPIHGKRNLERRQG